MKSDYQKLKFNCYGTKMIQLISSAHVIYQLLMCMYMWCKLRIKSRRVTGVNKMVYPFEILGKTLWSILEKGTLKIKICKKF